MANSKNTERTGYAMISPTEAWNMLQGSPNAVLVDVRSDMEYLMIGHPVGAIHVSWIDAPTWETNPNFVADVRKLLLGRVSGHSVGQVPILLICRSNNRSMDAASTLVAAGIRDVFVIEGGFEGPLNDDHQRGRIAGWRFEGLPWEQC